MQAYKAGTGDLENGVRTYGDTAFLSLPQGKYDFKIRALENSRVDPIYLTNLQSYSDSIVHQTISFDGGKINLITLNNDEGWDCTSKVINKDGKVIGGGRTYGRPQLIEVNPGVYSVEIEGLIMNGLETKHVFKEVVVESGKNGGAYCQILIGKD